MTVAELKCIVCAIKSDQLVPADFLLNGHSVCTKHWTDVAAEPGAAAVTISKPRQEQQ